MIDTNSCTNIAWSESLFSGDVNVYTLSSDGPIKAFQQNVSYQCHNFTKNVRFYLLALTWPIIRFLFCLSSN